MARFSTSIELGGKRVELNVPIGSKAWRYANAIFSPVGPAPTRGWFIVTKSVLDDLPANSSLNVVWKQHNEGGAVKTLTFKRLYIVGSERLLTGGEGEANSLYLVELACSRYLVARASETGSIIRNMRSYANNSDYLTGTSGTTWSSLVEELWDECGLLGDYPGLPFAPDGVPQNNWLVGLNAWKALCTVLDQLDCAIAHNPLTDVYTIVQLGGTQTIPDEADTLRWNSEPGTYNSFKAADLRIYFRYHRKSYGQERDTELSSNWVYNGMGDVSNQATGITGATGRKALWDDLPWILDENGTQTNSAATTARAEARKTRYVTRVSVSNEHRIHFGLLDTILPGAKVRAVLWRNWNDGVEGKPGYNKLGGTVTEFIAKVDLVDALRPSESGQAWFGSSESVTPERENYSPPDLARPSYPTYPRIVNIVQVNHSGSSAGDTVAANSDGFHLGRVKRWVANAMVTLDDCWIRFVDTHDTNDGDVDATQGEYYGPGRLCGISTSNGQTLPVYLVKKGGEGTSVTLGLPFYNASNYTIPPCGIMDVIGDVNVLGFNFLVVDRPSSTFKRRWLVNGNTSVAPTGTSRGFWLDDEQPKGLAIDPGSLSILATVKGWGPKPESFYAFPAYFGFTVDGSEQYVLEGTTVAQARQHEVNFIAGTKLQEDLEYGGRAKTKIWHRTNLRLREETGFNPVYVEDGMKLQDGDDPIEARTRADIVWNGDAWELANAGCSPEEDSQSQSQGSPGQFASNQAAPPSIPSAPSFM